MRKSSGFNYSLIATIVDTPKGKVRSIQIVDHEVLMNDLPSIHNQMTLVCNDVDLDTNKSQLKELCEFLLEGLK